MRIRILWLFYLSMFLLLCDPTHLRPHLEELHPENEADSGPDGSCRSCEGPASCAVCFSGKNLPRNHSAGEGFPFCCRCSLVKDYTDNSQTIVCSPGCTSCRDVDCACCWSGNFALFSSKNGNERVSCPAVCRSYRLWSTPFGEVGTHEGRIQTECQCTTAAAATEPLERPGAEFGKRAKLMAGVRLNLKVQESVFRKKAPLPSYEESRRSTIVFLIKINVTLILTSFILSLIYLHCFAPNVEQN